MIELQLRPMQGTEHFYCYAQSQQLSMQTGLIGHLRADMDTNRKGFFSSWFSFRDSLKSDSFKQEFDKVLNELRGEGHILHNRATLSRLCSKTPESAFNNGRNEFGFRVDTEHYTMKKPTDLTRLMTSYLCSYLPLQRNVSQNTITSYCDTFRLLLTFLRDEKAMNIERVRIRDFSPELVREDLSWLEQNRGCGISTRNLRLAALRSFFKYISVETPENMLLCQKIVNIPYAKKEQAAVCYQTTAEMANSLRQPDQSSSLGRRNLCFLSLLYDTSARVSEILALNAFCGGQRPVVRLSSGRYFKGLDVNG